MVDITSMLYERDAFAARYPELAARYADYNTADYVLYVQKATSLPITLPPCAGRICIIVGQSASVRLHHAMTTSAYLLVHLEPYALLHLTQSVMRSDGKLQLDLRCFGQASSEFVFNGWYTQAITAHIATYMQGQYAQAQVAIGAHMQQEAVANFTTIQHHQASGTLSSLQLKGLVQDAAGCTHTGTIHIDVCAAHVDAKLHSNFMLLGNRAQAYCQPILEVLNNQVRCAHGSSIGSCDDDQLFYLHSRGVDDGAAKQLLCDAFLADIRL